MLVIRNTLSSTYNIVKMFNYCRLIVFNFSDDAYINILVEKIKNCCKTISSGDITT